MLLCAFKQLPGAVRGLPAFCLWEEFAMTPFRVTQKEKGGRNSLPAAWRNISTQGGTCLLPSSLEPETLKSTWRYSLKMNSW